MTDSKRRNSKPTRKSSKPHATSDAIPERGLKIGEAARALGVEPYVLRFWETQFPILKPRHSRSRHRFYQASDIQTLQVIKRLLHSEGFTIAGANKYIRQHGMDALVRGAKPAAQPAPKEKPDSSDGAGPARDDHVRQVLEQVRRDLESLHRMLG